MRLETFTAMKIYVVVFWVQAADGGSIILQNNGIIITQSTMT
jgi:hypothetical protein